MRFCSMAAQTKGVPDVHLQKLVRWHLNLHTNRSLSGCISGNIADIIA